MPDGRPRRRCAAERFSDPQTIPRSAPRYAGGSAPADPPPETVQFCKLLPRPFDAAEPVNRYDFSYLHRFDRVFHSDRPLSSVAHPRTAVFAARQCDSIAPWRPLETASSSVTAARTRTSSASCTGGSRATACRASSTRSPSAGARTGCGLSNARSTSRQHRVRPVARLLQLRVGRG